ncbi:hypothetical protein PT974_01679 [Cladobotryum mycophilum]|uniref:Rhodopsin domain-containing protein n=1 Tax=Cladobotryum mycophilum TaxID=491253 RepID=A0ABR0SX31_9HYPO
MLLILPLATTFRPQMLIKGKIGVRLVFSVGTIACLLDLSRIIELGVDTDDKVDPSYGIVMFLILSAATEVAAIVCASLPIINPELLKQYEHHCYQHCYRSKSNGSAHRSNPNEGFEQLDDCRVVIDCKDDQIQLGKINTPSYSYILCGGKILAENNVKVTLGYGHGYGHRAHAL